MYFELDIKEHFDEPLIWFDKDNKYIKLKTIVVLNEFLSFEYIFIYFAVPNLMIVRICI